MRNDAIRGKTFTRRAVFIGGGKLALFGVLGARLTYLQVHQAEEFATLSEENRIKLQLIQPPRGRLLDRFGGIIANNAVNYQLIMEPQQGVTPEQRLRLLQQVMAMPEEEIHAILGRLKKANLKNPVQILEHLEWDDVAQISLHRTELPGFEIEMGQLRHYPLSTHTAHLTGYVGLVAETDEPNTPLLKLPDFKIGKNGIEKQYDEEMRGRAGIRKLEVDAHGLIVRELTREESKPGADIHLSIDIRLQEFIVQRMGVETGSVVVMDCFTGELLALVSMPGYDPNILSKEISKEYWAELQANKDFPLINKSMAGQYPPGSTFKMMTALAGLESGVVNEHTSFFCPGHVDLGSHRFHCWKRGGHGTVNLNRALAESCDTYFYLAGQKMGVDKIAEVSRRFGLGSRTGVDLPGEKSGLIPDQAWKKRRFKIPWLAGETLNTAIGQGYVLTTPLQLAVMTARIANGGIGVVPTLRRRDEPLEETLKRWKPLDVKPELLQKIQHGMYSCVNLPGGTALGKRIADPTFEMAGKTGTAQVKKILRGAGSKSLKESRREFKHHAWFVAYAPYNEPRYAITVLVEHGESGSGAAAPVARDVMLKLHELLTADQEHAAP